MDKLIDLNAYPVSRNLKALLKDKTTKKNIIFATSVYSSKGIPIKETEQMTEEILKGFTQYEIQPRVLKNREQQEIKISYQPMQTKAYLQRLQNLQKIQNIECLIYYSKHYQIHTSKF